MLILMLFRITTHHHIQKIYMVQRKENNCTEVMFKLHVFYKNANYKLLKIPKGNQMPQIE